MATLETSLESNYERQKGRQTENATHRGTSCRSAQKLKISNEIKVGIFFKYLSPQKLIKANSVFSAELKLDLDLSWQNLVTFVGKRCFKMNTKIKTADCNVIIFCVVVAEILW